MQQFLYVLQVTRPEMLTDGPTDQEMAAVGEHFAYLQKLLAEGTLILAGRTQTTHPGTMGLAIFNANSMEEALAIKNADPAIVKDVMTAEVYPYQIALIKEANIVAQAS
jgi:uncharacterized protein YciI